MSIDSLARQLSRVTREQVEASLDVEAKLQELHITRVRRRRARLGAAMAASCAAFALAVVMLPGETAPEEPAVARPTPSAETRSDCPDHAAVTCPDDSTVVIEGRVPYTLRIPSNFSRDLDVSAAPLSVDADREEKDVSAGVTVLTGVRAAGRDGGAGAEALARWVRSRSFLRASRVEQGTLDGLDAWTVQVELANRKPLTSSEACNGASQGCWAVLEQPGRGGRRTGVWDTMVTMVSRYTFLDVPGLGVVAVWSWAFGGDAADLEGNEALVRSIDFHLPS
jgi:hypothetical protein